MNLGRVFLGTSVGYGPAVPVFDLMFLAWSLYFRLNYLPVLATKFCVIQNMNLKYRSSQALPADIVYALQI